MDGPRWAPGYQYLSREVAPISFRYKEEPEDFVVEERLGQAATGAGGHLWLHVQKRGLSTQAAAARLARALDRDPRQVGYAGLKDVHAITQQWFSVEGADPSLAAVLDWPDLRVLSVERSERGLRTGQLQANRFQVNLLGVAASDHTRVEEVLGLLEGGGLPNYYGAQRFGRRGRNQDLGRHLLEGDDLSYLTALLEDEGPAAAELLRRVLHGTWAERRAAGELVGDLAEEHAAVARQLVRRPKHTGWLVRSVSKRLRRLHLSALQSVVFNRVVSLRLAAGGLGAWWEGDLIPAGGRGGVVPVEAALADAPLHQSATGPIPGTGMPSPQGAAGELELTALSAEGLDAEDFESLPAALRTGGARRPLRVPVTELDLRRVEGGAQLSFVLPAGSYATTLLEELAKAFLSGTTFPTTPLP